MVTKNKKVSLDTLLKKKKLIEENITPFYSDFFEGEIDIDKNIGEKIIEIMASKNNEMYKYYELIYTACPLFRGKGLAQEYECDDPILVVKNAFGTNVGEIMTLGNHILKAYNLLSEKFLVIKKP